MTADLMITASATMTSLSQDAIDEILCVTSRGVPDEPS